MLKGQNRKIIIIGVLSLLLVMMQITGWQISMEYGTSVHQSAFFQNIGKLSPVQCVLLGIVEFCLFGGVLFAAFSRLERRSAVEKEDAAPLPRYFWFGAGVLLYLIYMFFLIGCYPGFYNYDVGTQIPQVLYREVPYDAHHPLLHTFVEGGIIKLGYLIHGKDLTFGVFLYCAFQMAVCAVCFTYAVCFVYRHSRKMTAAAAAFFFYAFCPPIVVFAMSTTKDNLCYTLLLVGTLELYEIYGELRSGAVRRARWWRAGILLTFACLFRNNILYALAAFAFCAVVSVRQERRKMALFYAAVAGCAFFINKGLILAVNAPESSVTEALSVPLQQVARLYAEEGEGAYTEEELELLYSVIDPAMLPAYDPFNADTIKYSFWLHLDTLMERKWEFAAFWMKKGVQYPGVYLSSFLDNTYQAWYPGTVHRDKAKNRYFDITDWQAEYGRPGLIRLYNYFCDINDNQAYRKVPVLRLFFSIGAMLWASIIVWFYGLWMRDRRALLSIGLILWVCATSLCGPVSDVRYYLILFYMLPVCGGILFGGRAYRGDILLDKLLPMVYIH